MFCLHLSVKTAHEIQGRLWTGKDEILAAFGQVQLHDLTTSQQGITMKANLSQLFQVNNDVHFFFYFYFPLIFVIKLASV